MRSTLLVLLFLASCGCGGTSPTMAGRKWADTLHDPDPHIRKKAAFTLGNIGESDPAVLPALTAALHDTDAGVRCEAILALLKCGSSGRQAVPLLQQVRDRDRDSRVRSHAARALEKMQNSS